MSKLQIYLAGKIYPNDWRHDIVSKLRNAIDHDYDAMELYVYDLKWPMLERAIFGCYDYVGPYFLSCDHGGFHGDDSHGFGGPFHDGTMNSKGKGVIECCSLSSVYQASSLSGHYDYQSDVNHAVRFDDDDFRNGHGGGLVERARKQQVVYLCREAIKRCNLFFAWIEDPTAYGTLVELGMASSLGKPIYIAYPKEKEHLWTVAGQWNWTPNLWFAEELAHKVFHHCESASVALADAIEFEVNRRANGLV